MHDGVDEKLSALLVLGCIARCDKRRQRVSLSQLPTMSHVSNHVGGENGFDDGCSNLLALVPTQVDEDVAFLFVEDIKRDSRMMVFQDALVVVLTRELTL